MIQTMKTPQTHNHLAYNNLFYLKSAEKSCRNASCLLALRKSQVLRLSLQLGIDYFYCQESENIFYDFKHHFFTANYYEMQINSAISKQKSIQLFYKNKSFEITYRICIINTQNSNYKQAANNICRIRIESFLSIYYLKINADFTQHDIL